MAAASIAVAIYGGYLFIIFWALISLIVLYEWISVSRSGGVLWWAGGLLVAGSLFAGTAILRMDEALGREALLILFAVVWATDVMAYVFGKLIGGPKLCLKISPKKTWAGFIGGTVSGAISGAVFASLIGVDAFIWVFAVSVILALATHAGDLLESAVKRHFGVKDSSHLIPGHGGFMDRLDGFTAALMCAVMIGAVRSGWDGAAQGLLIW